MRMLIIAGLPSLSGQLTAGDTPLYERFFTDRTLRLDYYHTGTKGGETLSLVEFDPVCSAVIERVLDFYSR